MAESPKAFNVVSFSFKSIEKKTRYWSECNHIEINDRE